MRYPIDTNQYFISNGYQSGHLALDLAANQGVHVKAPESGMVVGFNKDPSSYFGGLYVVIAGDSGHRHYMGHHSAVHVNLNQRVSEGQHIADVGSTGLATGPHVHWEVSKNGVTVDPTTLATNSEEIDMERVDELFKKLDATNKRLDAANKKLEKAEIDKQKLWGALHRTNKNGDLLKVAIDSLSRSTGSKINLDDYEIQLVKKN